MEKFSQEVKNFFTTRNWIIILIVVILLLAIGSFVSHREGRRNMMFAQGRGFERGGMMFGGKWFDKGEERNNCTDAKNPIDIQKIMDAKDFQTFSSLASGTFLGSKINTPELFAKFLEMKQDLTNANAIGAQLGLPGANTGNNMMIFGGGKNMMGGNDRGNEMMKGGRGNFGCNK
ncbi:MAG: hypothetical protein WC872_02170 [Candidatus Absconditabacterales bacterium]